MGTTRTPPYVVRYRDQRGWQYCSWEDRVRAPYRGMGKPTDAKAEQWRRQMNASFQAGGSNEHLAKSFGFVPHISHVAVCRNVADVPWNRVVVAEAQAPMFEVV